MRSRQSLNGWWDYRIGEGEWTKKKVPYSAHPVGRSECKTTFAVDTFERAFLVLEGITYSATVILNGKRLGDMLPYCEYRYEVTNILREKNELTVILEDISPEFGPSEGWENYGGIIRGVYLEYVGKNYIEDVWWSTTFEDNYTTAHCRVEIKADTDSICVRLVNKRGECVGKANGYGVIEFDVLNPDMWSPDSPTLYTLEVAAGDDIVTEKVGFKDFGKKGRRFTLNGSELFLLGINRHDLWGDHGHTLTEEEMQQDMRMIKAIGINYVRLVHYPHNRRILEIADEIGLLVSEEPGLWWSNMSNQKICEGALEVLRRTILRDRNHISVAFWLSFNECIFTMEYLLDSVRISRETDPYHMVSGANCMSVEMTKENYPKSGFDFYTMHPYSMEPDRLIESAEKLNELPLLLTEWGGWRVHDNPRSFKWFTDLILQYSRNPEDKPVLAGAAYWCWADMYEFSRGENGCSDGLLKEGLVDAWRNPTPNLDLYTNIFRKLRLPEERKECGMNVIPVISKGPFREIDITNLCSSKESWEKMIEKSRIHDPRFYREQKGKRRMDNGPVLCEEIRSIGQLPVKLLETPYVVNKELIIPINEECRELHLVGNVSMPKGWPINGEYGELAAKYVVTYTDGTETVFPMRNGFEITTATAQYGPSRINPVSAKCPRVLYWHYDFDWEHYIANHCILPIDGKKKVLSLKLQDAGNDYDVLFYGITIAL